MSILCLTGWQQPHDALKDIAPDAVHFDYASYDDTHAMFESLPRQPKLAIGWSLGGQLLVRAVAGGHVRPQSLLLLGAPFQWVADARFVEGVTEALAEEVKANYRRDTRAMLTNLHTLIALGDAHEKTVARTLNASLAVWSHGAFWLNELAQTSCMDLDFSGFPPTLLIHGAEDKVVHAANAQAFARRMPQAKLQMWEGCAHAPQLHDAGALRKMVGGYV